MLLGLGLEGAGFQGGHRLTEDAGTHGGDPVKQLTAGFLRADGDFLADQHIAGVQPLVHLHDGNAGLGVAVQNSPLHGGAAAVLGQQGHMQVDAAILRSFQHGFGQDAAVGHHHDEVRGQRPDVGILAAVPQGAGLEHGGPMLQSNFLDRGRGKHLLAAHRLIPPGVHAADLVTGSIQGLQALRGNIRGSHEQNAHQLFPFASRAAFLPSSVSS